MESYGLPRHMALLCSSAERVFQSPSYGRAHHNAMQKLTIKTGKKREVLDITETLERTLKKRHSSDEGICNLFILHTTAALTTADLDPGTDLDMLDAFEAMLPKLQYRHPHNPGHVRDHILSSLIGTSVALPFQQGKFVLGTWQRVVLVELDGPRERELVLSVNSSQQ